MKHLMSQQPVKLVLTLATVIFVIVMMAGMAVGADLVVTGVIAAGFLGVGLALSRAEYPGPDVGAAAALIGQPIALTAAFQGHGWQTDTHMLFFALLACLIVLRSIPAIVMATAIIAVHHLSLGLLMPALVFPGGGLAENLGRTAMHAAIVLLEAAALVSTVLILKRLDRDALRKNADLEQTVEETTQARREAEEARRTAETTREAARAAQARAEELLEQTRLAESRRAEAETQRKTTEAEAAEATRRNLEEQARVVDYIRMAMQRLKDGDLTARIDQELPISYRDIGLAFNDAVDVLDLTLGQVTAQAEDMKLQVQEIASAAADLATRTERQAQMLRESAEGLEELTRVVSNTEATVREADTSAKAAQTSAKSSETVVSQTSQAMQAIQTEAEEIAQIVKVIDEIAFQTNLLALNAGVEAARAGDAGRGFAVVAAEVRGLAQRSSESATNIRSLIERSGQQVQAGSAKIEETVTALSGVLSSVLDITTKMGKIAEGAQEQTIGISELNQRVAHLDTTTQQNAAMFEETSAACLSLQNTATMLQGMTGKFRVSARPPLRMAAE